MSGAQKSVLHLDPMLVAIVNEIATAMSDLGATSGLMAIIGSWGDTLPDEDILEMFKDWNAMSPRAVLERARHELITLNGLVAADGAAPADTFDLDTSGTIRLIDDALSRARG